MDVNRRSVMMGLPRIGVNMRRTKNERNEEGVILGS